MRNYELVNQWASTLNVDAALKELSDLKEKYTWLKCDQSLEALRKFSDDLPKIVTIIMHQEKQNAIHRQMHDVTTQADKAIIEAMIEQYQIKV